MIIQDMDTRVVDIDQPIFDAPEGAHIVCFGLDDKSVAFLLPKAPPTEYIDFSERFAAQSGFEIILAPMSVESYHNTLRSEMFGEL